MVRSSTKIDTARVSVCMATYNGRRFIEEQIQSILCQIGSNDELLINDDCSTDDTVSYLSNLNDPRIKIEINSHNLGHVRNFERCLSRATGNIIIFSDQDDRWHPEKITWTRDVFEHHPDLTLVHHGMRLVDEKGLPVGIEYIPRFSGAQSQLSFLSRQMIRAEIFGSAAAIRSSAVKFLLPFPPSVYAHDHWMAIANGVCGKIFLSDRVLVDYRQHAHNLTPRSPVAWSRRLLWRVALLKQLQAATTRCRASRIEPVGADPGDLDS